LITRRCLVANLADDSGDLVVEGAEILLVGLKEFKEVVGGIGGDTVDILGGFSHEFRGHLLDGIERISGNADGVGEDVADGVPGVRSSLGDGSEKVTEESTASDLADEVVQSVVEEVGQVKLGNQVLGVLDGTVDDAIDGLGDVVEQTVEETRSAFTTEERSGEIVPERGNNVDDAGGGAGGQRLHLVDDIRQMLGDFAGNLVSLSGGIADLLHKVVGFLLELLEEGSLEVISTASGKAQLEHGLVKSWLGSLDQVGRKSGIADREAGEEDNSGELHGCGRMLLDYGKVLKT